MTNQPTSKSVLRLSGSLIVWVAVAATFLLTIYSLWLDRTSSAAVAGAFTLSLVIFKQLPIVESVKVFTLEAKFTKRLGEAETLLEHIRSSARVSSKLLYWQIANGDRMTSMGWGKKRALIAEFDALLASLDIAPGVITEFKRPVMQIVSLDLFRVLEHSIQARLRRQKEAARMELADYQHGRTIPDGDAELSRLIAKSNDFDLPDSGALLEEGRLDNLAPVADELMIRAHISDEDLENLKLIRDEVVGLAAACRASGTITTETVRYLEQYTWPNTKRVNELFGTTD